MSVQLGLTKEVHPVRVMGRKGRLLKQKGFVVVITVDLDYSEVMALFRCLAYGEAAVSQEERSNGVAESFHRDIHRIRKQITDELVDGDMKSRRSTRKKKKPSGGRR